MEEVPHGKDLDATERALVVADGAAHVVDELEDATGQHGHFVDDQCVGATDAPACTVPRVATGLHVGEVVVERLAWARAESYPCPTVDGGGVHILAKDRLELVAQVECGNASGGADLERPVPDPAADHLGGDG